MRAVRVAAFPLALIENQHYVLCLEQPYLYVLAKLAITVFEAVMGVVAFFEATGVHCIASCAGGPPLIDCAREC